MEKFKPENCQFGAHINQMEKDKLVDLCSKVCKNEPLENLKSLEQEDLIQKYQSAWMENAILRPD